MGAQARGSRETEEQGKIAMRGDGRKEVSAVYVMVSLGPITRRDEEVRRKDNMMPITLGGGRTNETREG